MLETYRKIMNEENELDHIVDTIPVEGPIDMVMREGIVDREMKI